MANEPHMKKIEATHIEASLFDAYDEWASGRTISSRDRMRALFRLFVAAPPTLKHLALAGRPDEIEAAALFYAEKIAEDIVAFAEAVEAKHAETQATSRPKAKRSRKRLGPGEEAGGEGA